MTDISHPAWYSPPPEDERTDTDRDDNDVAWNLVVRGSGTLLNSTEGHLAVLRGIRYGRAHRAVAEAVAAERERLLDCAKYDAQMDGPKFMAWDRSALDRLRKEYETSRAAPRPPAGKTPVVFYSGGAK